MFISLIFCKLNNFSSGQNQIVCVDGNQYLCDVWFVFMSSGYIMSFHCMPVKMSWSVFAPVWTCGTFLTSAFSYLNKSHEKKELPWKAFVARWWTFLQGTFFYINLDCQIKVVENWGYFIAFISILYFPLFCWKTMEQITMNSSPVV